MAVPLASFLAFSVQPLVGKLLLPVQGGTAPAWLGTMLYFQTTLLLGYGWALWLLRRPVHFQVAAMGGLALIAVTVSRLRWVLEGDWTGYWGILLTLALATLPAMVLLFQHRPVDAMAGCDGAASRCPTISTRAPMPAVLPRSCSTRSRSSG